MSASSDPSEHPEIKPDYVKVGPLEFHPIVFPVSATLILLFVIAGALWAANDREAAEAAFSNTHLWIAHRFGWFYILSANIFLAVSVYLIFSKVGRVRLGGRNARPDYSYGSWFAMLFSAGMGIGLLFWSVAEPISHYANPPEILPYNNAGAAREAMSITFYHWGLHAWGIYAIVGGAIAFFAYNRGLPLTIRSAFHPILGKHVQGPIGHVVDILAVVATLFGVATSLGLGVKQVNAGLNHVFPNVFASPAATAAEVSETALGLGGTGVQMLLIVAITLMATASVVSGLDKGIKTLSEGNLLLAFVLMLMVFFVGPTWHLLDSLVQNLGGYFSRLIPLSFWTEAYRSEENAGWQDWWTIFYWGWWIAWSPFVGMFIARISRGRTVREFTLGVLLVPTALTFIWLTIFGNTALYEQELGAKIVEAVDEDVATALFKLLELFPLSMLTSIIAIIVVITFFVTSSDSGSLVIDTITGGGHPHPPVIQKVFWALLEGAVAAVLLFAGGLSALQTASITTGLPFAVVLLIMTYCLVKALHQELRLSAQPVIDTSPTHSPEVVGEHTWEEHHPKA